VQRTDDAVPCSEVASSLFRSCSSQFDQPLQLLIRTSKQDKMPEDSAAEERRKRAQARKDKISSRGADRLAKITGAAKGEGASAERFGTGGAGEQQRRDALRERSRSYVSSYPRTAATYRCLHTCSPTSAENIRAVQLQLAKANLSSSG